MPSPFPGMDPYLEDPALWPDFHNAFAAELRSELNRTLPGDYYAQLESRPELGIIAEDVERRRRIVPDVTVLRQPGRTGGSAVIERPRRDVSPSLELDVDDEAVQHPFVEIREAQGDRRLVTLIEILSPSNKRSGPDREAYAAKQRDVLRSAANLIEVDLLRAGERIVPGPALGALLDAIEPPPPYLALVSRAWRRAGAAWGYSVYPFGLREWLPCIAVPLRRDEPEVPLDLQYAFQQAYDGGPYRRGAVDYGRPPTPPLEGSDADWAEELLRPRT